MPDAVVIGAGPNGLVAANMLADAGWDVLVVEEQAEPGGAVKSAELTEPGFVSDVFSSFFPLAVASRPLGDLHLEDHGLRWLHSAIASAHPSANGTCALLSTDLEETAASMESFADGDGEAWRRLYSLWEQIGDGVMETLGAGFPPLRASAKIAARLGPAETMRLLRMSLQGVRRLSEERFAGAGGGRILADNALHADLAPESPPSAIYGFVLASLGQQHGFPVPEGGAGRLTDALVARLVKAGGEVRCGERVDGISVRAGRATGVRLTGGDEITAKRAILADVDAPQLYRELLPRQAVSNRLLTDLEAFQFDYGTVKVDWSLEAPIPWMVPDAGRAGTVHVTDDMNQLTQQSGELAMQLIPAKPFLVMGQYSCVDPSRMPPGKEVAWAYTHIPQRSRGDAGGRLSNDWNDDDLNVFAERIEEQVERVAPGFRTMIRKRHILGPHQFGRADRNLVNGALNGGTAQLHQQLVFRPTPGLARPETPIRHLYLCSAAIHPGGGVHGACGANAARAALAWDRARRAIPIAAPAAFGLTRALRARRRKR
ncbi:MAG TPA: NAD(P)/FAD-dependent oxidoreductase [Baekduia sp.]|nr:NAD(P)/FAD-dependent oxidoreductase [Baekduia sp.]